MAAVVIDSPRWREGWGEAQREGWGDAQREGWREPQREGRAPARRPDLRVLDGGREDRRARRRVVRRRRRLAVVAAAGLAVALALAVASNVLARPATAGAAPQGRQTQAVEVGDTYWSIAAEVAPDGADLRLVVDQLIDANGARPLVAGDRIEVPLWD